MTHIFTSYLLMSYLGFFLGGLFLGIAIGRLGLLDYQKGRKDAGKARQETSAVHQR